MRCPASVLFVAHFPKLPDSLPRTLPLQPARRLSLARLDAYQPSVPPAAALLPLLHTSLPLTLSHTPQPINMAATFRPVNSPLPAEQRKDTIATPTMTPRPSTAPSQTPRPAQDAVFSAGALASQKPLPNDRFPDSVAIPESTPPTAGQKREREHSQQPSRAKSDDVAMNESEGEPGAAGARGGTSGAAGSTGTQGSNDEGHGSGDESNDGNKSKKKKSQRFYCTDYPPCNLSFTRSEHLARHIRYVSSLVYMTQR